MRQVWEGDGVTLPVVNVEASRLHLMAAGGAFLLLLCCCGAYWRRRRTQVVPAGAAGEGAKDSDEESEEERTEAEAEEAKHAGRRSLMRKQSAQQGFVASNTSPNRIAEAEEEGMPVGLIRKRSSKKEKEGSRRHLVEPGEEEEGSRDGSRRRGGDAADDGEELGDSGGSSGRTRTRGAKADDQEVRCAFTPARLLHAPPLLWVIHLSCCAQATALHLSLSLVS